MSQTSSTPTLGPSDERLRELAVRRLKKKQAFRGHLTVYVAVNLVLWGVWVIGGVVSGWVFPWPVFPTVFWGLFVLGQANDVYWRKPLSEEAIQAEVAELRASPSLHRLEARSEDVDCC